MKGNKTALIAGASGLIGGHLLQKLLADNAYEKVISIGRKKLDVTHEDLTQIEFDFTNPSSYESLPKVDIVFCCLGTTIKRAGSQEKFKQVDFQFPLDIANWAKNNGVSQYHIITALGADKDSSIFYNQVKGEIQDELKKLNFESLNIYQPSLLLGERDETRIGELLAKAFMIITRPLMLGGLRKYRAIKGTVVAQAMLHQSHKYNSGINLYESDEIEILGNNLA